MLTWNVKNVILSDTHAIAVVKTKEEYFGLRAALRNIVKDVNELQREKKIVVDGKEVPLDLFLGGDYKVSESLLYSIL